jgi:8-oxo-dGTP diphosphatase
MSRPAADRIPIAAAVIVVDGRLLLVRRAVAQGALVWQFPARKMEPGESAEDAVREAGEETGLTVRAVRRLGQRVHPLTGRTMTYVACEAVAGTAHVAAKREVAEVVWCDRATLATLRPISVVRAGSGIPRCHPHIGVFTAPSAWKVGNRAVGLSGSPVGAGASCPEASARDRWWRWLLAR